MKLDKKDKKIRSCQQIIKNIMEKKINYTKRSKIKKIIIKIMRGKLLKKIEGN